MRPQAAIKPSSWLSRSVPPRRRLKPSPARFSGPSGTRPAPSSLERPSRFTRARPASVERLPRTTNGDYTSPLLATGVYTLRLQAAGFKPTLITGIALTVDSKVRINVTLEAGGFAETIVGPRRQHAGATVLVGRQCDPRRRSDRGGSIERPQLRRVDANNAWRRPRRPGENIDGLSSVSWRHSSSLSANGQRTRDNNFLLDGLDNNQVWINSVAIFPNLDALDEVKVQTGIYSAEFGRSLGAVVSLQTKSGANAFRGLGFEFLRNGRFHANDWFNNRARRPKPDFSQHQFGGTFRGPNPPQSHVLLRRLPGPAARSGPHTGVDGAERGDAARRLFRASTHDLRPAHRSRFSAM